MLPKSENREMTEAPHELPRIMRGHNTLKPPRYSLGVRLLPGLLALSYLVFTVLIFVIGPWPWPVSNPWKLYTFLLPVHLAFIGGYWRAIMLKPVVYKRTISAEALLWPAIAANLLLCFPTLQLRLGTGMGIYEAITNPGVAYSAVEANFLESSTPLRIISALRFFLGPVLWLLLPLCVFYWRRLSVSLRTLSVAAIASYLILWFSMGKTKGIIDFGLLLPCLMFAAAQKRHQLFHIGRSAKTIFMTVAILGVLILIFLWFTSSRGETADRYYDSGARIYAYEQKELPRPIEEALLLGSSYLSQGYYGLSLCLDAPFVWTYGVGNAPWLSVIIDRIFGIRMLEVSSYPDRIDDTGWNSSQRFHTIYPWIASDVSFYGTVLVIFLIGRLFGLVWIDCLHSDNPLAVGILGFLILMIAYFPVNNQIMQFMEQCSGFLGVLGMWFLSRWKSNRICTP